MGTDIVYFVTRERQVVGSTLLFSLSNNTIWDVSLPSLFLHCMPYLPWRNFRKSGYLECFAGSSSTWSVCEVFGSWWIWIGSCKKRCSGISGLDTFTWSFALERGIGKN
jgi:hypothetical protein